MNNYKFSRSEIELLKQVWNALADNHSGKFRSIRVESYKKTADPIRRFELIIPFETREILFLTSERKPLKVKFEFSKDIENEFLIYPEDYTDKIAKLFGLKEFETGIRNFDKRFFIKTNDKALIMNILTEEFRNYLLNNHIANFKLETIDEKSVLEFNLLINELDISEMEKLLMIFKKCVTNINK